MSYFAILGKHKQISLAELQYIQSQNLTTHGPIVIFDTEYPLKLAQLGGIIKRGTVVSLGELSESDNPAIVGTNSRLLGKHLKSSGYTRRFKELTLDHSDREVQDKGQELILIHSNETLDDSVQIGIVTGYQDIGLFEAVDFDKPSAGMGIGMMPSKLALTMINIALAQYLSNHDAKAQYTIYDPFCGFGTTNFLANAHGHNTIGSDINASLIKPNLTWWQSHDLHTDNPITSFKHNATQPIAKPFVSHTDVIVSEGWLGPVVNSRIMPKVAHHQLTGIGDVYLGFIQSIDQYFDDITMCITIPVYRFYEVNVILDMVQGFAAGHKGRTIEPINQYYERKGQYVMRQILVLQKRL